jgi:hypothetical protein
MDRLDHQYVEDDMMQNYAHGPSRFDHLIPPKTTPHAKGNTSYTHKITPLAITSIVLGVVYYMYT